MNIGEFKHRISILEPSKSVSENGFLSNTWNEKKKTWSKIERLKKEPNSSNEKEKELISYTLYVRSQPLSLENRIMYKNKIFEIQDITDEDFTEKFLKITVQEVK